MKYTINLENLPLKCNPVFHSLPQDLFQDHFLLKKQRQTVNPLRCKGLSDLPLLYHKNILSP